MVEFATHFPLRLMNLLLAEQFELKAGIPQIASADVFAIPLIMTAR